MPGRSAYQDSAKADAANLDRPAASFAASLLAAGVTAVVAMSFNVYVTSAKAFMEEFYGQLQKGQSLSIAASLARKHLSADHARFIKTLQTLMIGWCPRSINPAPI